MTVEELVYEIEKSFDNIDKVQIRKMANIVVQQSCDKYQSACPLCQFENACKLFVKLANVGLPNYKET